MTARLDFRASNNADWRRAFSLTLAGAEDAVPPWSNVPAWSSEETYQSSSPASVVVRNSNLYVASAVAMTPEVWVEAEWTLIGDAELFVADPVDLTGAKLVMRLAPIVGEGVDLDKAALLLSTDNSAISVPSPSQGGIALYLSADQARAILAGAYVYDLVATWAAPARVDRLLHGVVTVEQGIS